MTPQLSMMPDVVLNRILKFADFKTILILRKVNQALRDFIDDQKPDTKFEYLSITVKAEGINVICYSRNQRFTIKYQNEEGECVIENGNDRIIDGFRNDLTIIIQHQKTVLKKLRIVFESFNRFHRQETENVFIRVSETLENILSHKIPRLKTTYFKINSYNENQILSILPYLNQSELKEIRINKISVNTKTFEIDNVVKLEHWRSAEKVIVGHRMLYSSQHFGFYNFEEVTLDDVLKIKTEFLNSLTLERLRIQYTTFYDEHQFLNDLGPPITDQQFNKWYLCIQNSGQVIQVLHYHGHRQIIFSKIESARVLPTSIIKHLDWK